MDNIRQYILSVITAALICGIVNAWITGKGTYTAAIKIVCGLFLTVTIISPLAKIEISDPELYFNRLSEEAEAASAAGTLWNTETKAAFMKDNLEKLVLEKSMSMNLKITTDITVDDTSMLPTEITISGTISPYAKRVLSQFIQDNLGIPEEDQNWM